jgi:uncharacterized membrane protein
MAGPIGDGGASQGEWFESGRDIDRVVFFSDAVFAIAMTVLALSLRLPSTTTDHGVAQALQDALPSIYSYVLSFVIISLFWLAHHRMFHYICRVDAALLVLNLATLGLVAFVPFPTSVLGDHNGSTAAVVFYASTMVALGGLASALWAYAAHDHRLVKPETPRTFVVHSLARGLAVPAVFAVSIPIAFANPSAAEWFWLTIAVVQVALRRRFGSIYRPDA